MRLVEVFREVRRVLHPSGVAWVNMGDAYAGSWGAQSRGDNYASTTLEGLGDRYLSSRQIQAAQHATGTGSMKRTPGLKPKDLVGQPWRLAFALQQPYYSGKIKNERDRIWLAAMIEAEGCLFLHRRKEGQSNGQGYSRKADCFGAGLEVANTSEAIVKRCLEIAGIGSICSQGPEQNSRRKQRIYRWNVRSNECRSIIQEVYPYFVSKKHQARLLLSCPSSGVDAEKAWASLKSLHRGGPTSIDFKEPESLFQQGFYLRRDVIWSKLNPMPESCEDRPTTAHEYVFLLSKRARYFYDGEAVRERDAGSPAGNGFVGRHGGAQFRQDLSLGSPGSEDPWQPGNGRNLRSVWTIPTEAFPGSHFATFPRQLAARCIAAGTSLKGCCPTCLEPWRRVVEKSGGTTGKGWHEHKGDLALGQEKPPDDGTYRRIDRGFIQGCECPPAEPIPCTVLDPFAGSGTTLLVALGQGRRALGIELNPEYVKMARKRIVEDAPLFNAEAAQP